MAEWAVIMWLSGQSVCQETLKSHIFADNIESIFLYVETNCQLCVCACWGGVSILGPFQKQCVSLISFHARFATQPCRYSSRVCVCVCVRN